MSRKLRAFLLTYLKSDQRRPAEEQDHRADLPDSRPLYLGPIFAFRKKSQLEHILLSLGAQSLPYDLFKNLLVGPDTYVGSIETQRERLWVWDDTKQKIVQREVSRPLHMHMRV